MSQSPPCPASGPTGSSGWSFAIVGLLGIITFFMLAVVISQFGRRAEPAEVAAETSAIHFVVRETVPMPGTNLVQIVIASGPEGSPYSSGGRMADTRNILLLDRASGTVRRLLPDNNIAASLGAISCRPGRRPRRKSSNEIAVMRDAEADTPPTPPTPPAYFALLVAQPDHDDSFDLLIGTIADNGPAFVMPGLAGVDGIWMQSPTQVALLVREGLNLLYRIVDIPSRRVVLSRRIAI